MDARGARWLCVWAALAGLGASFRTANFQVVAPTPQLAQQVAESAERYRRQLAETWLGQQLPAWSSVCPITVMADQGGPGGATSFGFDRGHVVGWQMIVQGPADRILVSVLPHEVTHTILASYFRAPVPRWADEGAATLAEDEPEQTRQVNLGRQLLQSRRAIPLRSLFVMTEYPRDVIALYAQGHCVTRFLVEWAGRKRFLDFLADGQRQGWDLACRVHYQLSGVDELEQTWLRWMAGTGLPGQPVQLAGRQPASPVVRAQSPAEYPEGSTTSLSARRNTPRPSRADASSPKPVPTANAPAPDGESPPRTAIQVPWTAVPPKGRAAGNRNPARAPSPGGPGGVTGTPALAQARRRHSLSDAGALAEGQRTIAANSNGLHDRFGSPAAPFVTTD